MSKSKHTPGPWEYNDPAKFKQVGGPFSDTAVYAKGNAFPWRMAEIQAPDQDTEIATARLIAAAPDYDDGARDFIAYEDAMDRGDDVSAVLLYATASKKLRAAIAKAEGK